MDNSTFELNKSKKFERSSFGIFEKYKNINPAKKLIPKIVETRSAKSNI